MLEETNKLFIKDENGKEIAYDILFTFENEQLNKKYVLFVDPQDEEGEVFASCYDDEGHLLPIETDEEWEMVEEVLGAFDEEDL